MCETRIDPLLMARLGQMTIADIELWLQRATGRPMGGVHVTAYLGHGYKTPHVPGAVFYEVEDLVALA